MSILNELEFVKRAPKIKESERVSPVEKARSRLINEIDTQIELARNPEFEITKTVRKRDGTTEVKKRKPRAWFSIIGEHAYIQMKISNVKIPLGGKRGGVVRCAKDKIISTLTTIKEWAQSSEATATIESVINKRKRKTK